MSEQPAIHGNKLALAGAVWYLLEFVVIIPFHASPPPAGSAVADLTAYYTAHQADIPIYVAGVSAAILGRLAFISGLRSALQRAEGAGPLLDLAFASAIVAVVVETVSLALYLVALSMATFGPEPPVIAAAALHNASTPVGSLVGVAYGLVAVAASLAMLQVPALPRWLGWLGLVAGVIYCLTGNLTIMPDALLPSADTAQFLSWLAIVAWMLATGAILWRASRRQRTNSDSLQKENRGGE